MNSETLARRLGTTEHLSPLLMKARRLGLVAPEDFEKLAVRRGLRYYSGSSPATVLREDSPPYGSKENGDILGQFSNEELALALLSPCFPYSQNRVRIGGAILADEGNSPVIIAKLARKERGESVVKHIALLGRQVEPGNPFWTDLLVLLRSVNDIDSDKLPHLTRFVAMTGITRRGKETVMQWIRPSRSLAA